MQPIELHTRAAADSRHIPPPGGRHHLGGHRRIGQRHHMDVFQAVQEAAALADGLLMGVDFPDVLQLCPGSRQQIVVDFQAEAPDNVEIMLQH